MKNFTADAHSKFKQNRLLAAKRGYPEDLDILVHDSEFEVRVAVAIHGRPEDLSRLVHDRSYNVRIAVAGKGRPDDLNILVNDSDSRVLVAVVEHGRPEDLDKLIHSSPKVRQAVAKYGRPQDLDILVNDKDKYVVKAVIQHGREKDLVKLKNSRSPYIREYVNDYRRYQNDMAQITKLINSFEIVITTGKYTFDTCYYLSDELFTKLNNASLYTLVDIISKCDSDIIDNLIVITDGDVHITRLIALSSHALKVIDTEDTITRALLITTVPVQYIDELINRVEDSYWVNKLIIDRLISDNDSDRYNRLRKVKQHIGTRDLFRADVLHIRKDK